MSIGIDPTVDFAFKKLLGSPEHPEITIHFLNSVLGPTAGITSVTIVNPILNKDFDNDKSSLLDVLATDASGQKLNIEMQTTLPTGMCQRLAYYASSLYVEQLQEGDEYSLLRPAISICVLSQRLFLNVPDMHLDFRLRERNRGFVLTDDLQIHTIELPKSQPLDNNTAVTDPIEKWAWFLRFSQASTVEQIRSRLDDDIFVTAAGVLQMISKSPQERMLYNARMKMQRDEASRLLYAEREGIAKGEAKGKAIGEANGKAIGEQIGAVRLLQQLLGLPETTEDVLSEMTAVSRDAIIADLKSQLKERARLG